MEANSHLPDSCRAIDRELLDELKLDRETLRAMSYAFYRSIVADQRNPVMVRLWAQMAIDRLLGLHAPCKIEIAKQIQD
ncbi:MAG: hypothetical protein K1X74_14205 [Pirellulales bacterium]|nr:hypothetical protein [Pirellulales bacterium]